MARRVRLAKPAIQIQSHGCALTHKEQTKKRKERHQLQLDQFTQFNFRFDLKL